VTVYAILFALGQACLFGYMALEYFGLFPGKTMTVGSDFLTFYTAGRLAWAGTPEIAYDLVRDAAAQAQVLGYVPDKLPAVFSYPPTMMLLCGLVAPLPLYLAQLVWNGAGIALWLAGLVATTGDRRATLLLATFPTAFICFYIGQTAFITSGLFALGLALLERRPAVAGLVLGLLCYKPHFLVLVPFALVAIRAWRSLAGLTVAILAMTLASLLLLGIGSWIAYLHFVPGMSAATFAGRWGYWAYATPFAAIRTLGGSMALARWGQAGIAIGAACATILIWYRRSAPATRAITLVGATLLANPIIVSYDVMLATVAMAWIVRDHARAPFPGWVKTMLAADWLIAFAGFVLAHRLDLPLLPLIGFSLLVLGILRARGLATAQSRVNTTA
jgi:hypothetical protein